MGFQTKTYEKNPEFAAVAFLDVDANGDGTVDFTVYGDYNPNASATVTESVQNAYSSMTDTQKGWIDNLLSKFGA